MENAVIKIHNPKDKPINKAVIWLHGLGADGHDFEPIVPELGLSADMGVRFIFPNAPMMPVTINGGYVMSSWYDIVELGDLLRKVDITQIATACQRIQRIIKAQEAMGIALSDIVLAGFSQGGAVAYHTALKTQGLGGLLTLSTYFATAETLTEADIVADFDLPIFIQHGSFDDVVSPYFAERAKMALTAFGFSPKVSLYPVAHHLCPKQIGDIGQWLNAILTKSS